MKLLLLAAACALVSSAQPTVTTFNVSGTGSACGGLCATASSGNITFTYAFSGSPPCTNASTQTVCEVLDNYNNATTVSSASGTVTVTPSATRSYHMLATNSTAPSYCSTARYGPCDFIPIFYGAGTLSVTVGTPEGCVLVSSTTYCPQYGAVKIDVVDNSGPCTSYSQTHACSGSSMDSNGNPIESSQGRIIVTQPDSTKVIVDAHFCPLPNTSASLPPCAQDNTWAFEFRCVQAGSHTWTGYYGNQSNYAAISGSFTCSASGGNIMAPLRAYGSNRLWETADGHIIHPVEIQNNGNVQDFGQGISDTNEWNANVFGYNYLDAGGQVWGTRYNWASAFNAIDITQVLNPGNAWTTFRAGCYSTNYGPNGIYKCGAGQIYPMLTQGAPGLVAALPSLEVTYEVVRNLYRSGHHVTLGGPLVNCSSSDSPNYLVLTNNCDVLQNMTTLAAYTHALKLLFDEFGPYIDTFAAEAIENSAAPTFASDYYIWMAGFIHEYPNILAGVGYTWVSGAGFDVAIGPDQYFTGATQPATSATSGQSGPELLVNWPTTTAPSNIPVCRSEGGQANDDSDHNWIEVARLENWFNAFTNNCSGWWPSFFGIGGAQAGGVGGNANIYIGDMEAAALMPYHSAWWDMDPAAQGTVVINSRFTTCSDTLFAYGIGSSRDVMIHVSKTGDRTTCTGGSLPAITFPAAMIGYWYSTLTGAIVGSQVSVSSGSQTVSIPTFGNAANCAYPTSSCNPDHLVLRLRGNVGGQPLMSQVMLPSLLQGASYSQTISAQGCVTSCTYAITTGNFPDGITMTTGGVISGTSSGPAGTRIVGVTPTDASNNVGPEQRYWIEVFAPISFDPGSTNTIWAAAGAGTIVPSVIRGGIPPVKCSASPTTLPNTGIVYTSSAMCYANGTSNGTAASDTVTLTATDAGGNTATQTLTVQTTKFGVFVNSFTQLAAFQNVQLTQNSWWGACWTPYNASGTWSWSTVSGSLPPGLSMTTNATGGCQSGGSGEVELINGTPTTTGTYSITLNYTDGNGTSPNYTISFTVNSPQTLTAATISESANTPFIYNLTHTGGSAHKACQVTGGVVPVGVLFDVQNCTFYGTSPNASSTATVMAMDPWGSTQSQNIAFSITGGATPPTLSSLSPNNTNAGGSSFTLTVNASGSSFVSGATVYWNGTPLTTSYVNTGQVTATVLASMIASAGTASVTATNPSSVASNSLTFTINAASAPTLSSLSPNSATAGSGAFTLTVNASGASLVSGATVYWNGSPLTTTYVSTSQVTAAVGSSLIGAAGTASVTATNPGSAASNALTFTINGSISGNPADTITYVNSSGSAQTNYPIGGLQGQIGRWFAKGEFPGLPSMTCPQLSLNGTTYATQVNVDQMWSDHSIRHAIISAIIPSLPTGTTTYTFIQQACTSNTGNQLPLTSTQMEATGYNFDAKMALTNGSTVSADALTMLTNAGTLSACNLNNVQPPCVWAQGQIAQTVLLGDNSNTSTCNSHACSQYDYGFTSDNPIRTLFAATFWPGLGSTGAVYVRVATEIAQTQALENQTYNAVFTVGSSSPTTCYNSSSGQGTITHYVMTRWFKGCWLGVTAPTDTNINRDNNLAYEESTYALPYYDLTVPPSSTVAANTYSAWRALTFDVFYQSNNGSSGCNACWAESMGAPGNRPDIGPYTGWITSWAMTGDYRYRQIVLGNGTVPGLADMAGSWPIHLREGKASTILNRGQSDSSVGLPVSVYGRPTMDTANIVAGNPFPSDGTGGDVVNCLSGGSCTLPNGSSAQPWQPDPAHFPETYVIAYGFTGDYFYLEQAQFAAAFIAYSTGFCAGYPCNRSSSPLFYSCPHNQVRNIAWCFRTIGEVAALTPSSAGISLGTSCAGDSGMSLYFCTLVNDAAAVEEGVHEITNGSYYQNTIWNYASTTMVTGYNNSNGNHFNNWEITGTSAPPTLHQWTAGSPGAPNSGYTPFSEAVGCDYGVLDCTTGAGTVTVASGGNITFSSNSACMALYVNQMIGVGSPPSESGLAHITGGTCPTLTMDGTVDGCPCTNVAWAYVDDVYGATDNFMWLYGQYSLGRLTELGFATLPLLQYGAYLYTGIVAGPAPATAVGGLMATLSASSGGQYISSFTQLANTTNPSWTSTTNYSNILSETDGYGAYARAAFSFFPNQVPSGQVTWNWLNTNITGDSGGISWTGDLAKWQLNPRPSANLAVQLSNRVGVTKTVGVGP